MSSLQREPEYKRCRDCDQTKRLIDFSPAKKNRDGRTSYCRACLRERHARYRDVARGGRAPKRPAALAPPGTKWCPDCEQYRAVEAFGKNRASRDGLTGYCLPCHAARGAASRERNGGHRNYHLKRRYGITAAEYDALLADQDGLCAVCRERPAAHVDHDHAFGQVRGLLCSCCNQGLGNFRDDREHLRAAVDYLERTTWQRKRIGTGVYQLPSPRPAPAASVTSLPLQHLISCRRG
jgi:hypothetical protein